MPSPAPVSALRLGVLAVSVLHDVDITPSDEGVTLDGPSPVHLGWDECSEALDGATAESAEGRARLTAWILFRRAVARHGRAVVLRPFGAPTRSTRHPGPSWTVDHVLGDALDLGFAVVGLHPGDPERVVPVPYRALNAAGVDVRREWTTALEYLDNMGAIAAERLAATPNGPLKPVGDCDVVTLLGSGTLRAALAARAHGMCPAVIPMRTRGWTDLRRVDPAFALAAASATADCDRGFERGVLITADEVTLAADGGRAVTIALGDAAVTSPWNAAVPYV